MPRTKSVGQNGFRRKYGRGLRNSRFINLSIPAVQALAAVPVQSQDYGDFLSTNRISFTYAKNDLITAKSRQ